MFAEREFAGVFDPLALRLDVAIPQHGPLLDQRDLDNYLFPARSVE